LLIFLLLFRFGCLLLQLLLDRVVLLVDLVLVLIAHHLDGLLGFFGAEVRLVVLLLNLKISGAPRLIKLHLHADVLLVLAEG